jgi:glycosyltransferase involved in cell wall biosynthesis
MKIVRIIARLNVGGPARHVVWLTQALQNNEFKSTLLAGTVPAGEEDMSYFAAEHNVSPKFIEQMSRELSPKDVISLWKVFRELWREKPDIIHTHTAKAGTIGRVAGFVYRWLGWKNVKIIHTYHGHIFHSYYGSAKTRFFLFIEKTLARLATDKIVVITDQQFEEIHHQFGVGRREQFEVVTLGIDLQPFQNWAEKRDLLRRELKAEPDEILVGLVGRLTEIKNHSFFLQVAKSYREQKRSDSLPVRFVIIGDGHLRPSLEAEAEALGITDIVTFLGNRNDTDVFYAGLDIVALTSHNEGTPLSLIEGMANARAVISTAVGGVVDLLGKVEHEEEGFAVCQRGVRVPPKNLAGFVGGLHRLAGDENLRRKLGQAGQDFIYAKYSKETLISNLKNLYENLVGGGSEIVFR